MQRLIRLLLLAGLACSPASAFPGAAVGEEAVPKTFAYAEYSGCTTTGSTNTQVIKCSTEGANVGSQITQNVSAADGDHWTVGTTGIYTSTITTDAQDNLDTLSGFINTGSLINDAQDLGTQRRTGMEYRTSPSNQENHAAAMIDEVTASTEKMYWVHTDLRGTINYAHFARLNATDFARYTGGSSKGSTNNLVTTGYSLADSTNNPITLSTSGTLGDTFSVDENGLYVISVISQSTGSVQISVGSVQNSLNTADHRATGRPEIGGTEVSTYAMWAGFVATTDDIYVLNENTSITETDADLHQIAIYKLATTSLAYGRWDSGNANASINNNVITGYTSAESSGTAATLSTNGTAGDRFSVPADGLYAISFNTQQSTVQKNLLVVGASVQNSFATSEKVIGDLFQIGGGFIVIHLTTSDLVYVMSDTDPVDDSDMNQITFVKLDGTE